MKSAEDTEAGRIREAMLDLCYERGLAAVTLPDLLERAAVDQPAFERHFGDLEDLTAAVYREAIEQFHQRAERARAKLSRWRDRVRVTAYALYRYLAEDERLLRFAVVEIRFAGERVHRIFGEEVVRLFDLIDEGRGEPEALPSLTRATAESVGGGINNQIFGAAGRGGPLPPEGAIIPQLMYSVVLPYLGLEAAQEELRIPPPPLEEC